MLVYNQELRFPSRPITERIKLGGVLLHDAGNVFQKTPVLRPFDARRIVRTAPGIASECRILH